MDPHSNLTRKNYPQAHKEVRYCPYIEYIDQFYQPASHSAVQNLGETSADVGVAVRLTPFANILIKKFFKKDISISRYASSKSKEFGAFDVQAS